MPNLMKFSPIFLMLLALGGAQVSAQVTAEVVLEQEQFMPGEPLPLAVKITNRSGRTLNLGAEPDWLTFSVESAEGMVVVKNSEVPVVGAFDLESSQEALKRVDIQPHFQISKPGRYKITATLRIKDWSAQVASPAKIFDIVNGTKLWAQEFGLPATNGVPEMRRYTLQQASYLKAQMRLYAQVSDAAGGYIHKTRVLGPAVSFNRPEAQVDRFSLLHVLWQSGAQAFNYTVLDGEGNIIRKENYDDFSSRPRLTITPEGDVKVIGGVRRLRPGEIQIKSPEEIQTAPQAN